MTARYTYQKKARPYTEIEIIRVAVAKRYPATMKRGARDHPIGIMVQLRNLRINKKRAPVERHFGVINRVFKARHVMVSTI